MNELKRIYLEGTIWQLQQDIGAANMRIGRHEKAIQAEREIIEAAQQRLTAARFQLLSQEYGVDLHVGAEVVMIEAIWETANPETRPFVQRRFSKVGYVGIGTTPDVLSIYNARPGGGRDGWGGIPAALVAAARKLWLQQQETKP